MSLLMPIAALAGGYLVYRVLSQRTRDAEEGAAEASSADPDLHDDSMQCPNAFTKWISLADVYSDKCAWEWDPTIVSAGQSHDGLIRTDLCSRHGRCPTGLIIG